MARDSGFLCGRCSYSSSALHNIVRAHYIRERPRFLRNTKKQSPTATFRNYGPDTNASPKTRERRPYMKPSPTTRCSKIRWAKCGASQTTMAAVVLSIRREKRSYMYRGRRGKGRRTKLRNDELGNACASVHAPHALRNYSHRRSLRLTRTG